MKERPILFSAPMVRALLDGRKTQTRRVVKPQPTATREEAIRTYGKGGTFILEAGFFGVRCPYGQLGDRLWVRETWGACAGSPVYRADDNATCPDGGRWKPSIHMPRWASRITLEVTGVRVERLQDISEEDAIAEGVPEQRGDPWAFQCLWDSINGARERCSWAANPWVWAITFSRRTEDKP